MTLEEMNATKEGRTGSPLSKVTGASQFKEYSLERQPDPRTLIPDPPFVSYVSVDRFYSIARAQYPHMSNVNSTC